MRKRIGKAVAVIGLLVVMFCGIVYAIDPVYMSDKLGQLVEPGQVHTAQDTWITVDTTTSTGTEPTDLATDERTCQTVLTAISTAASGDDEISVYGDGQAEIENMNSFNAVRFRCIGITDNGTITYQIYLGTLGPSITSTSDCNLVKAGQLAFVIGQQSSTTATYEMADQVTVTAADWVKSWGTSNPASNQVAEASIDLMGADLIVVVPTTASCDAQLLMKGY